MSQWPYWCTTRSVCRLGCSTSLPQRWRRPRTLGLAALALVVPLLLHILPAGLLALAGTPVPSVSYPSSPEQIAIAAIAPLGEEFGWRAYAERRLEERMPWTRASLVVGVMWSLWHLPFLWAARSPLVDVVASFAFAGGSALWTTSVAAVLVAGILLVRAWSSATPERR